MSPAELVLEAEPVADVTGRLAVLLERWQLKPKRSARRLRDIWSAFEQREAAECARYQRVAALGAEIACLLDLPPKAGAAIRGSAFLLALARAASEPEPDRSKRTEVSRGWEKELLGWNWVQVCTGVLRGLQPTYEAGRPLSPPRDHAGIETSVVALAGDFEQLTGGRGGMLRALQALSSKSGRQHDPQVVELLLSEAGQAACAKVLRRGAYRRDSGLGELEESVRLLEQGPPSLAQQVPRELTPRRQEKAAESSQPASPPKGAAWPKEDQERRDTMSRTTANEQRSATTSGHRDAGGASSLAARVAAAQSELEEIRAAANRGLEALASITPAIEELSALVSRLQAGLSLGQASESPSQAGQEPNGLRSIALRVERPQGPLDVGEAANALDGLLDLRHVRVQDQGSSWAVLQAETNPDTDLALLQAKAVGALTRQLGGGEDGGAVEVTVLESG